MTLSRAYASASETPIDTIEIMHSSLSGGSVYLCSGFRDLTATLEDARVVTFTAIGANIKLQNRGTEGAQVLQFALDNTSRFASDQLKLVIAASKNTKEVAKLAYRGFLPSSLSAPSAGPYLAQIKSSQRDTEKVVIGASFFYIGNMAWPQRRYNTLNFPLIKYV